MSADQKPPSADQKPPSDWPKAVMHVATEIATVLIILGCLGSCTACAVL